MPRAIRIETEKIDDGTGYDPERWRQCGGGDHDDCAGFGHYRGGGLCRAAAGGRAAGAGLAALGLGFVAAKPWNAIGARVSTGESAALRPLIDGPALVLRTFLITMADEKFVIPLCCAMGFARVLAHTGCDKHLVQLLVRPLRRVRFLLLPGAVLVGFAVNIPVISQTSTAATVGPVLVPLLQASRVSPATSGAALLLGASVGGELLNPGAPEIRTVVGRPTRRRAPGQTAGRRGTDCVRRVLPLVLVQLAVATLVFWLLNLRAPRRSREMRCRRTSASIP
jgi:DcuC family C4-dicarboxylate transporter